MRHLLNVADLTTDEILRIFALTADLKAKFRAGIREPLLPGRVMALLFEKQSLRTRVSFQAGMAHLGGSSMMLGDDAGFGKRETHRRLHPRAERDGRRDRRAGQEPRHGRRRSPPTRPAR